MRIVIGQTPLRATAHISRPHGNDQWALNLHVTITAVHVYVLSCNVRHAAVKSWRRRIQPPCLTSMYVDADPTLPRDGEHQCMLNGYLKTGSSLQHRYLTKWPHAHAWMLQLEGPKFAYSNLFNSLVCRRRQCIPRVLLIHSGTYTIVTSTLFFFFLDSLLAFIKEVNQL